MREDRLKEVLEFMRPLPPMFFNMNTWQNIMIDMNTGESFTFLQMQERGFLCGSAACIGGITELYANQKTETEEQNDSNYINARLFLGLTHEERAMLFFDYPGETPEEGWKQWMIRRLEGILEDGFIQNYQEQMEAE